ncbi:MAG: hypothetical protein AAF658_06680 [Myxococcota bacterium]
MSTEAPVLGRVIESNNAFFVMVLDERETPDLAKFEEQKDALRETEISKKRTRVVNDWVEHLRDAAKIEFNPVLFDAEDKSDASA